MYLQQKGYIFLSTEKSSGKKKSYHPTNLASNFEVLVMLKDIIILKAVCAQHLDAHTLIAEAAQIKSLRSTFEKSQPASLKQPCSYIAFPILCSLP